MLLIHSALTLQCERASQRLQPTYLLPLLIWRTIRLVERGLGTPCLHSRRPGPPLCPDPGRFWPFSRCRGLFELKGIPAGTYLYCMSVIDIVIVAFVIIIITADVAVIIISFTLIVIIIIIFVIIVIIVLIITVIIIITPV